MITPETVSKLRADRVRLLEQADGLALEVGTQGARDAAEQLGARLRAYTSLVEAVLDAMSADQPPG